MSRRVRRGDLSVVSPQPARTDAPFASDGFHALPPGKIAAIATYLELRRDEPRPPVPAGPWRFEPLHGQAARYRALYAAIGRPWMWFSRAGHSEAEIAAIIDDRDVEALALVEEGRDVGLVELDFRKPGECEIAFLGLVPGQGGAGRGRVLVAEGVARAFLRPVDRLWLHTCTLDHPAALRFYRRAGLRPYLRAVEIADDPRLTGRMPRDAAPDLPIL
jgi:ribosomal protein S18 acetylase RimI-like enzyme